MIMFDINQLSNRAILTEQKGTENFVFDELKFRFVQNFKKTFVINDQNCEKRENFLLKLTRSRDQVYRQPRPRVSQALYTLLLMDARD